MLAYVFFVQQSTIVRMDQVLVMSCHLVRLHWRPIKMPDVQQQQPDSQELGNHSLRLFISLNSSSCCYGSNIRAYLPTAKFPSKLTKILNRSLNDLFVPSNAHNCVFNFNFDKLILFRTMFHTNIYVSAKRWSIDQ